MFQPIQPDFPSITTTVTQTWMFAFGPGSAASGKAGVSGRTAGNTGLGQDRGWEDKARAVWVNPAGGIHIYI